MGSHDIGFSVPCALQPTSPLLRALIAVARASGSVRKIWPSGASAKVLSIAWSFAISSLSRPYRCARCATFSTRASRSYCQSMRTISVMSRSISASGCARRLTNRNVTGDKIGAKVLRPQSCSGGVRADHTRLALVAALPPYRDLLHAAPGRQTPKRCDVPGR